MMRSAARPLLCASTVLTLAVLAACGDGGDGGAPPPDGPATLAYAVSECREGRDAALLTRQALYVRQGDGEPRRIIEYGEVGPLPPYGLCRYFGLRRLGAASVQDWPLQRLGVSPDGGLVVFEVTDDFSVFSRSQVPPEEEGIYVVHADGSGLRRLGPASRAPCFVPYSGFQPYFPFSPDGRTVTFADLDPDLLRLDARQIFTLDVASAERTQLTHLPPTAPGLSSLNLFFLDAETIVFTSFANPSTEKYPHGANPDGVATLFRVNTDGTGLEPIPVVAVPGGGFIPNFAITSAEPTVSRVPLSSCTPVNGPGGFGNVCSEIFVFDTNPDQVLQLTNFRRSDTHFPRLTRDRQRVLFIASADPLGENPDNNCEFFSIDRTGAHLRQLTHIGEGRRSNCDSWDPYSRGCSLAPVRVDLVTGWVTFSSSCNPFGTNPYSHQIFTMRPDGTGLRQLTFTRGMTTEADGTVTVEQPGPWAVPGREY